MGTLGRDRWRTVVAAGSLLLAGPASIAAESSPAGEGTVPSLLDEVEGLRRSQREMTRQLEQQQERIRRLEAQLQVAGADGGTLGPGAADSGLAEEIDEYLAGGIPSKKGSSRLKFYGFVRLDAIWDDSRPSNTQTIGFVRSEDPTVPGGAGEDDSDFTMHPRLTRLGVDLDGGTVASLGDAKLAGRVEVDFYNSGLAGQSESRSALRMRHAYADLAWEDTSLLAGQTAELISPLHPAVNNDLVMWGAGNLGDRRAQVRVTHGRAVGGGRLTAAAAVGLTGAVDNQNLDGNAFRDGDASGLPTLQARVAWRVPGLEKRDTEIGVWGHQAWEEADTAISATSSHERFQSVVVGADGTIPLVDRLTLRGEWWMGRNLDDVRGGIFQGVNAATGREVHSRGGWVELGFRATDAWTVSVGASRDNPRDGDLNPGGVTLNQVYYLGNRLAFDPVEFGLDYMRWHTSFKGAKGGLDNRFQAYIAYHF